MSTPVGSSEEFLAGYDRSIKDYANKKGIKYQEWRTLSDDFKEGYSFGMREVIKDNDY